ncbi:MAG: protein kinase [Planctomycetia bacterium]|nr:protein kinase [Planctomycetia bacterium]
MPILTRCEHCQKLARVADIFAQRQVRCPFCKQIFTARTTEDELPTAVRPQGSTPQLASGVVLPRPADSSQQLTALNGSSSSIPTSCPTCKIALKNGSCSQCGWVPRTNGVSIDAEEQPLICTNPACGTANSRQARYCARCQAMLPSPTGTVLHDRYRVDRLLAIGGFGGVYLAHDVKANRPVAIKDMLAADQAEFATRLNFFRREAEILRLLEHSPIVPKVFDFIEDGQSAHLVMEYIPGKDLLKILESQGHRPFPVDLVITWAKQICDVLTLLHSQQPSIIHRDLKPDNIMLLEDGTNIRLIDFGTARELGKTARSRVAAKTRVYTEGYAPPEQVIGKPELRSDLFALAGTLYQLLTGKAPEGQYTALELRDMLMAPEGKIPPEQRWLYEMIATNLAEDANDRYFSAREFKTDLQRRAVTVSTACPACRHVNKVREPHCTQCAAPLTEPMHGCVTCGKVNRQGSRFCTQCGGRLR